MRHDCGMVQVYEGDALARLREIPSGSVHCVVTSPPYWGLRNYGADGQIGLEKTPEEYIARMVEVFGELWRVLRDDGTVWLNIGDSYASSGTMGSSSGLDAYARNLRGQKDNVPKCGQRETGRAPTPDGCKPKDLVGIPWALAFALRADGWYLRSEIIWHKPNPMPESVTDRPTKAHEQIFLLAKSERYFCDMEAVKEEAVEGFDLGILRGRSFEDPDNVAWHAESIRKRQDAGVDSRTAGNGKRNLRTVWTITTKPYSGAHFATFPPEIPERCIRAGTSLRGCCPACGAPWERVVDRPFKGDGNPNAYADRLVAGNKMRLSGPELAEWNRQNPPKHVGWRPTCDCPEAEPVPCIVLDPFGGSGTVGEVAVKLGRRAVLIELNPKYVGLMRERFGASVPLFTAPLAPCEAGDGRDGEGGGGDDY